MIDKQKILDHVEFYSADELVAYIQQGVVTLDELISETDGDFDATKRKTVKQKLETGDSDAWESAQKANSIDAVQNYLNAYPNGQFRNEARAKPALRYVADFQYVENGKLVVEDVKSKITQENPVYRIKKHLMMSVHGIEINEI